MTSDTQSARLPPIFVGGTGRSGSTILGHILGSHPDYACPPIELRFHADSGGLCDLLAGRTALGPFLKKMRGPFYARTANGEPRGMHLIIDENRFDEALERFSVQFPDDRYGAARGLLSDVMEPLLDRTGARGWVEMTPRTVAIADVLHRIFPQARFVHTVRDGRDVAASLAAMWWGPDDPIDALHCWAERMREAEAAARMLPPGRIHGFDFDRFVADPHGDELERLCRHVDIEPSALAEYIDAHVTAGRAHRHRWRHEIPDDIRDRFVQTHQTIVAEFARTGIRQARPLARATETHGVPPNLFGLAAFLAERVDAEPMLIGLSGTAPLAGPSSARLFDSLPGATVPVVWFAGTVENQRHRISTLFSGGPDRTPLVVLSAHRDDASLEQAVRLAGLDPALSGRGPEESQICIVEHPDRPLSAAVPTGDDFTVVALMLAYNEADIIEAAIADLVEQGVSAYVIDNWSTDGTYEKVTALLGHGVVGVERHPASGPTPFYDKAALLTRMEQLALELDGSWFVKHDADEIRRGPWPGVTLRQALARVDHAGYNTVDFTVADFPPVDNGFEPGGNHVDYFRGFRWGRNPGHFVQFKAWKNVGAVKLGGAGHRAEVPGRKVYPYKFLLRHYPVRSHEHGTRKSIIERRNRLPAEALQRGWHRHYLAVTDQTRFLAERSALFYDDPWSERHLIQRISGVGVPRNEQ